MNFSEAFSYLLSLGHETLTIKLGLANTERLLNALGNPQKAFPAIQIAGTNGKGSVAVTLASICRAAGIRAGLFTSPHLVSITERITIEDEPISESNFARLTTVVKETVHELMKQGQLETPPTFFEHVTAIALLAFRAANVELVILETGLGGRLDSTTTAGAEIVAITQIAMDHEEYLGHSLADIAGEKAAIIRPGVTAIVAPQAEEVLDVITSQCGVSGVQPRLIDSESNGRQTLAARYRELFCISSRAVGRSRDGRFCVTFETDQNRYQNLSLGLRGRHQIANVSTAIALAEALRQHGFEISRETIIRGVETARHPGRLELLEGPPQILFDGAHNPASARALCDYLDEFVEQPITMIFGAMRDKALDQMAEELFPRANELILTKLDNPRAASIEMLMAVVRESCHRGRIHKAYSAGEGLRIAKEVTKADSMICITGSLYLVGAVQQVLKQESRGVARQRA